MAECLEDTSGADTDRIVDSCGFLKEQFDIFKHDYREVSFWGMFKTFLTFHLGFRCSWPRDIGKLDSQQ